ncbi:lyase family protein [Patescibacteria group bacterium]
MEVLSEIGYIPQESFVTLTQEVRGELLKITTTEVDKVEREVTKHDIRALVSIMKGIVGEKLAPWVHVPLTSYDVLDTARTLQLKRAYHEVLKPSLYEVVMCFVELIEQYADTLQIGRTHRQHALPITLGFWLATILDRISKNWVRLSRAVEALEGKISGAVGAHNAQIALGIDQLCREKTGMSFETRVLAHLDLKPSEISTQILPPEPLADFLHACILMSGTLGQFGRDGRNLMSSEIGELFEPFGATQDGSSTMAHKRNPITFENLEGTWIKVRNLHGLVLDTLISEFQRDLVGSSIIRDFPAIPIYLQHQLGNLLKRDKTSNKPWLLRLRVDEIACMKNFQLNSDVILAEPLYILLCKAGYQGDAHSLVNRVLVPLAQDKTTTLVDALAEYASDKPNLRKIVEAIPSQELNLLCHPMNYIGDAKELALKIASLAEEQAAALIV